jgi:hypothetical protein
VHEAVAVVKGVKVSGVCNGVPGVQRCGCHLPARVSNMSIA